MADNTEQITMKPQPVLSGRREILTSLEQITEQNVTKMLQDAFIKHRANVSEIEYLYRYYKGIQPVLWRTKDVRPEICNHIVENRANAIVTFRVGYTVGKPIQYISSVSDEDVSTAIAKLNDMMRVVGKARKDKELVEWQMIGGTAYRLALPTEKKNARIPFDLYTVDPRQAFVVYRNDIAHTPLAGVYYTIDEQQNYTFYVYTDDMYYKVQGWQSGKVVEVEQHQMRHIPLIEYPLNMARLGAFEVVLPLLDGLNDLESNRIDSVAQFVQSLLIAINCQFDDGVTANTIREAGMVAIKSIGENKADLKVISESLDQQQTQTLKQAILDAIYEIAGIPSQSNGHTSDSSNNGAVILKNGWQGAETRAQDFEMMFSGPEHEFIELVVDICNGLSDFNLDPENVEPKFTRRNYEDILSKSQTLTTMLNNEKIHPQCAYEACGLFVDTQDAYNMGMDWYERNQKRLQEQQERQFQQQQQQQVQPEEQPEEQPDEEAPAEAGTNQGHYVKGYWKK